MKIPDIASEDTNTTTQLEIELNQAVLQNIYRRHNWQTSFSHFRRGIAKDIRRFEIARMNEPDGTKRERVRRIEKVEKATFRLLLALDDLSEDSKRGYNLNFLAQRILRTPMDQRADLSDVELGGFGKMEKVISGNSDLLRACRTMKDQEQTESAGSELPQNAPIDNLIRNLLDFFERGTGQRTASGCYYNASRGEYAGVFFDFANEIVRNHLVRSDFHSPLALGKRIVRVLELRGKKDKHGQ